MIIRSDQMKAFEDAADENFVKQLSGHLRENYASALVRLPEKESTVSEFQEEDLNELVRIGIEQAKSYGLTFESAISAFCAVMFEVAPNFDKHSISNLCLKDKNIEPNDRLDEVLKLLTEKHWEKIRSDYDVNAWKEPTEETEDTENPDLAETIVNAESPQKSEVAVKPVKDDLAETIVNAENAGEPPKPVQNVDDISFEETMVDIKKEESPKAPVNLDDISFDETMVDYGKAKKIKDLPDEDDIDLDKTIMNIDFEKE